jgi:outer membrane protein assembly factor BamA
MRFGPSARRTPITSTRLTGWWDHSLRLRLFGSYIDNNEIDDFFYLYMGGKDGIRGYTYYSIGGLRGAMASATYRFPIIRRINRQFQHLYFRDVWAGVFAETANAWTERGFKTNGYKTSAGYELRANFGSFYVFPATFSVVGAYAFDPVKFDGGAIGSAIPVVITQDIGWSHYFTLGFGFDL